MSYENKAKALSCLKHSRTQSIFSAGIVYHKRWQHYIDLNSCESAEFCYNSRPFVRAYIRPLDVGEPHMLEVSIDNLVMDLAHSLRFSTVRIKAIAFSSQFDFSSQKS